MAEQHNVVAYLYAATGTEGADAATIAIDSSSNKTRYIESRRQALDSPQAIDDWAYVEREQTEEPEDDDHDSLEDSGGLMIALHILPKGQRGTEVGCDPVADISLPKVDGVSYRHFSLTFNDDYCLVVRDLKSTAGTTVKYGSREMGPFLTRSVSSAASIFSATRASRSSSRPPLASSSVSWSSLSTRSPRSLGTELTGTARVRTSWKSY